MFEKRQKFSLNIDDEKLESETVEFYNTKEPDWGDSLGEGELAIDVYQTDSELIIITAMAGTPAEKLELHLHNDLLTIRGERQLPSLPGAKPYLEECFWGKFSRSIVLPVDVKPEFAQAEYKNGVLKIVLPKVKSDTNIPIFVVDE